MSDLPENFPKIAEQFNEKLNGVKVSEVSRTDNGEYYFTCENYVFDNIILYDIIMLLIGIKLELL